MSVSSLSAVEYYSNVFLPAIKEAVSQFHSVQTRSEAREIHNRLKAAMGVPCSDPECIAHCTTVSKAYLELLLSYADVTQLKNASKQRMIDGVLAENRRLLAQYAVKYDALHTHFSAVVAAQK